MTARIDVPAQKATGKFAVFGLIASIVVMILFAVEAGASKGVATVFVLLVLVYLITATRLRAETGNVWPVGPEVDAFRLLMTVAGTKAYSPADLTSLTYMRAATAGQDFRGTCMPHEMDGLKVADAAGIKPKKLAQAMMLAVCALRELVNPALTIMDAVVGMEGNGPNNGTPVQLGYLLAGAKPEAVDVAMARLAGVDPRRLAFITQLLPDAGAAVTVDGDGLPEIIHSALAAERRRMEEQDLAAVVEFRRRREVNEIAGVLLSVRSPLQTRHVETVRAQLRDAEGLEEVSVGAGVQGVRGDLGVLEARDQVEEYGKKTEKSSENDICL